MVQNGAGFSADLTLAGSPCNVYGNDIVDLTLTVEYQNAQLLNVKRVPKYVAPANSSKFILPAFLTGLPGTDDGASLEGNDLEFSYSNDPSWQFEVRRSGTDQVIFSTMGKVLVFEDQFLELATSMPSDYNVYGLVENIHQLRLGSNLTRTFYAADSGNPIDG